MSHAWLSLLFGVFGAGLLFFINSGEYTNELLGDPARVLSTFQKRSSECLIMSEYSSKPGPYTVEALMLNIQLEFIKRPDAHVGVWALCGLTIRLAMRLGYHRDSDAYPEISVADGENRRRVWAVIVQLDGIMSGQIGLPYMTRDDQCDTRAPSNLFDADYGPDSKQLPPSRPETELTPALYLISKQRVSKVHREILERVILGPVVPYDEIMRLDQELHKAQDAISPPLRIESSGRSATAVPDVLIRSYSLALLTQKSRCLLHCHYMKKSLKQPEFNFSRASCVEAAMSIMNFQATLLGETQVGGILHREKWLVSSLEQNDFLLASMIIALEFSNRELAKSPPAYSDGVVSYCRDELFHALQRSFWYLQDSIHKSKEARQAFRVLSAILRQASKWNGTFGDGDMPRSSSSTDDGTTMVGSQMGELGKIDQRQDGAERLLTIKLAGIDVESSLYNNSHNFEYPSLTSADEGFDAFLDSSGMIDWVCICSPRSTRRKG